MSEKSGNSNKGCGIVAVILFILALVMFIPRWTGEKSVSGAGGNILYMVLLGIVVIGVIVIIIKISNKEL
mgnify:CR=1 FL=1